MSQILGDSAEGEYARAYFYRMRREQQRSTELMRLAIDQYPQRRRPARRNSCANHFGSLARGEAAPEIGEVAAGLDGPSRDLLAAARHGGEIGLAAPWPSADGRLAEFPGPTPGIPRRWSCASTGARGSPTAGQTRRFGDEAIPMIDRMATMNPTLNLFGMRARAGFAAQRPARRGRVRIQLRPAGLGHGARQGDSAGDLAQGRVALRGILDDAEKMPGVDALRLAEVRAEIDRLVPAS